jgi:hypothetical protein
MGDHSHKYVLPALYGKARNEMADLRGFPD